MAVARTSCDNSSASPGCSNCSFVFCFWLIANSPSRIAALRRIAVCTHNNHRQDPSRRIALGGIRI